MFELDPFGFPYERPPKSFIAYASGYAKRVAQRRNFLNNDTSVCRSVFSVQDEMGIIYNNFWESHPEGAFLYNALAISDSKTSYQLEKNLLIEECILDLVLNPRYAAHVDKDGDIWFENQQYHYPSSTLVHVRKKLHWVDIEFYSSFMSYSSVAASWKTRYVTTDLDTIEEELMTGKWTINDTKGMQKYFSPEKVTMFLLMHLGTPRGE